MSNYPSRPCCAIHEAHGEIERALLLMRCVWPGDPNRDLPAEVEDLAQDAHLACEKLYRAALKQVEGDSCAR